MPTRKKFSRRRSAISSAVKTYVNTKLQKSQETKSVLASWNEVTIDPVTGTLITQNLSACSQGDTQNTRTGNSITVTGLYGKFAVVGADSTNVVRVIVYMPHDPDYVMSGIDIHSFVDQDRMTVLYDKYITVSTNGPGIKPFTIARKFNRGRRSGIHCKFDGTTATDLAKNPLKMYVVSDSVATPDPTLTGNIRCYFKDA